MGDVEDVSERLLQIVERLTRNFEDLNDTGIGKTIRSFNVTIGKLEAYSKQIQIINLRNDVWLKQRAEEHKLRKELLNIDKQISQQKHRQKMELDRQHEEGVQRNIRLRASFKDVNASFGNAIQMLKGVGLGQGISLMGNQLGGLVQTQSSIASMEKTIDSLTNKESELKRKLASPIATQDEKDDLQNQLDFLRTEKQGKQHSLLGIQSSPQGQILESSKTLKSMSQRLQPVGEWMAKHKTGIIISAASLGILVGLFKKMLSVSPMLQKMLELINMTFGLILRPFGDFIGFILKPIALMFLSMVMPFFKEAYPILIAFGDFLGKEFVKLFTGEIDPIEFLSNVLNLSFSTISPDAVLRYIFGEREDNVEGAVGTGGLILGATGLGASVMGLKALNAIKNRFFPKGGTTPTTTGSTTGALPKTSSTTTPSSSTSSQAVQHQQGSGRGTVNNPSSKAQQTMKSLKNAIPKSLQNLAPQILKNPIAKQLLRKIPIFGTALMLGSVGFGLLRAIVGEEEYQKMYKDLEWMGGAQDLFMDEQKMMIADEEGFLRGVNPLFSAGMENRFGTGTTDSGGVITYNMTQQTIIGEVNSEADLNQVRETIKEETISLENMS